MAIIFTQGAGYILIMFVLNIVCMIKMRQYQDQLMKLKDERVQVMAEVLNGIKVSRSWPSYNESRSVC